MPAQSTPQLSKSRFMAGLQCLKRLYLECYQRELADPIDPSQQNLFDMGTTVGELARKVYQSGKLIDEKYFEHTQAVNSTESILKNSLVGTLFEPAFSFEEIRTRVDILTGSGGQGFDLIEVKSSTSVKKEHIPDVAVQIHVLEGSEVRVGRAYLMHINNNYVYEGGPLDLNQFFSLSDVTDASREFLLNEVPGDLQLMWDALRQDVAPDVENGPHCKSPYRCPFYGNCHRDQTENPLEELPRLSGSTLQALQTAEIHDISNIPVDFSGLTGIQQRIRDCVVTGNPFIGPDLATRLGEIGSPSTFMDFETFNPAIPLYAGTRPYQIIPFQWSIHIRDETGHLSHAEFLNDDNEDPRERFIKTLLGAVPQDGPIVVYSGYEQTIMRQLAEQFPYYAERLDALCGRTFDLLKLIRENYYHPQFHGSNSIKSVLPALVPSLSYSDLGVQDGGAASIAYARMIDDATSISDKVQTKEQLLAYCARDTEAMIKIIDKLVDESRI